MRLIGILISVFLLLFGDGDDLKELHFPNDLSFLKLSSSQKESIRGYLLEYNNRLRELHIREELFEEELRDIFKSSKFNRQEVLRRLKEIKLLEAKLEVDFFEFMFNILNRDQRERFLEYIEEWEIE